MSFRPLRDLSRYLFISDNKVARAAKWPELFNYAVPENKLKWISNEWTQDQVSFAYADNMRDLFSQWEVPFRGHTLFWGVSEGDRTPRKSSKIHIQPSEN